MFLKTRTARLLALGLVSIGFGGAFQSASRANSLDLGVLSNYAVVDLGNGTTFGQNSGPVAGNELLGNGVKAAFSGGNNGGLTNGGILYYDSTVLGTNTFSQLQNPPTTMLVPNTVTAAALAQAQSVSDAASALTATQTFSDLTSATTLVGNGGLNVIDVATIESLKLSGTANDVFVFNVSGLFNTNQAMILGGVLPSHILFNFTGTSGHVFQTSGGDTVYGTFLATHGGQFQFSNLDLTGELINTGGDVQLVSGSSIPTFTPFTPPPVPLPAPLWSAAALLAMLGLGSRLRFARLSS